MVLCLQFLASRNGKDYSEISNILSVFDLDTEEIEFYILKTLRYFCVNIEIVREWLSSEEFGIGFN